MELHEKHITISGRAGCAEIIPIGDCHLGTINSDVDELKKVVDYVKRTPYAYWIGMGDYVEAIDWQDKRFDERTVPKHYRHGYALIQEQKREFISICKPILNAEKCIGLHGGNHEEKYLLTRKEDDIVGQLCWEFGLRNLEWKALTRLVLARKGSESSDRVRFTVHSHHGHGGGRKPGGKLNLMHDVAGYVQAHIHLMGHVHSLNFDEFDSLALTEKGLKLKAEQTVVATTGCFYRTYKEGATNYAERGCYPPSTIGTVKVTIAPWRDRRLHVERLWV